jgi:two-component system cell cycle sensor histidine kinase/response regulator CckA
MGHETGREAKGNLNKNNRVDADCQRIEEILLSLALKFIESAPGKTDELIASGLALIAESIKADRCFLYLFQEDYKRLVLTHKFNQEGVREKIPQHDQVDKEDFAWLIGPILKKLMVYIPSTAELPSKASTIKAIMEVEKTKSTILYPFGSNNKVLGILGVDSVQKEKQFPEDVDRLLKMGGNIFASALSRQNSRESVSRNEERYRTLFAEMEDVVFISTPQGKILEINPAGAKMFGYSSVNEMVGLDIEQDLYLKPADRKKYKEIMSRKGQVKDYDLVLKRKDGKKIVVTETGTVVKNDSGDIVAYQGILRDITYKRQLEEQLLQAQKMESIGLLAGGVAHDFNNILTTISGYAELIMMDMQNSDKHYSDLESIINGCQRAEDLIRQLLAFSRRQMIEPKVVDINRLISELNAMLVRLIPDDIKLELKLKKTLSCVKADTVQIQQILVNLVINAGYAIKKQKDISNGKRIRIVTDEKTVTKKMSNQFPDLQLGKFVVIAVEDTGVGMDENTKKKIFEPFFSTKKDGEGTGLGLSTVYGIIKQNNGNIYIESEPGRGSTFKVFWPASDQKEKIEFDLEADIQMHNRSETILFVEDDVHVRKWACNALKSFGYTIIEAEHGKHALELIKKEFLADRIDLVISDIVMPEMGGEELADSIREINPEINIILCSGFTDSRISMKDTHGENGYKFLPKPYTIKKLEKKVRGVLSKSH